MTLDEAHRTSNFLSRDNKYVSKKEKEEILADCGSIELAVISVRNLTARRYFEKNRDSLAERYKIRYGRDLASTTSRKNAVIDRRKDAYSASDIISADPIKLEKILKRILNFEMKFAPCQAYQYI